MLISQKDTKAFDGDNRPPLEVVWLAVGSLAASAKLLVAAWGSYLGGVCGLLLGPPARAFWASGKALLELLLPIWQVGI